MYPFLFLIYEIRKFTLTHTAMFPYNLRYRKETRKKHGKMQKKQMDKNVLLHLICQRYLMNRGVGVSVGDASRWMEVSKPTARRKMMELVTSGWLEYYEKPWGSNAKIQLFKPTLEAMTKYNHGDYRPHYDQWCKDMAFRSVRAVQRELI